MSLALAIVACMTVSALVALWATRSAPRWRRAQTALVALAPLAAFVALVREAPQHADAYALRVTGQYAPLADTISLGGAGSDVRVSSAATRARLWYDHRARAMRLRVDSGVAPVTLGGRPVNAMPLAHGTRVTFVGAPGALQLTSAMPGWPLGCLARIERLCAEREITVTRNGTSHAFTVRVGSSGVSAASLPDVRLARAPFMLATVDRRVYVVASPAGPVRVDGAPVPSTSFVSGGDDPELRIGTGLGASTLRVHADTLANRMELRFVGRTRGDRWPLATGAERVVHRVVASMPAGAGALRVIDMDAAAPLGTRARPYQGALEWDGAALRWHTDGRSRVLRPGITERLPGTGATTSERGHLVEVGAGGAPAGALAALALVWIVGALLVALGTSAASGALRVAVIGLVYTLALVRVTLAYRVAGAAPYNAEALPWAALFLAAFPLLVFLLERWPHAIARDRTVRPSIPSGTSIGARARRFVNVGALPGAAALIVIAGALAIAAGPLHLAMAHVMLGTAVVVTGTGGLLLLQRVLVAREAGAMIGTSPVAMLQARAERGFGARQVWRAFTALLVVVGLYVALAWSIRGVPSPLLAVLYAVGVGLAYAFVWARERVRPRVPISWLAWRAGGAALGAAAGVFLAASVRSGAGIVEPLLLGAGAGVVAAAAFTLALLPLVRPLRGWPYRRADVLPPPSFAALPVVLILVAGLVGLRRVAITLGYALAVAALLLVARVFAAWWHRETGRRVRQQLGAAPERVSIGLLVGPLVAALVVYLAYGVTDRGLLMLLLVAVLLASIVAAATVGRGALALAVVVGALVVGVAIPRALSVDTSALGTEPMALNTPQIRWAAIHAPDALAHQLALTREDAGREMVNMLQQDWGMRAYAASGGTVGGGLFSSTFGGGAIPEEVALTDNAFAVWVLGEHGFSGGIAVLGAFVALSLVLLGAARAAASRVVTAHLALLLAGIAAYIAVPALYMAAANVDLLPLTGQNFPLLGLRSGADVAFVAWLTALAVVALPAPIAAADDDPEREDVRRGDLRRLRLTLGAGSALVVVATAFVSVAAWRATHADVDPFALDTFAGDLRELVRRGDLVLRGDSLAVADVSLGKAGLRDGDLVRALVARSNALARGTAPARRQCLDRAPWFTWDAKASSNDVRVNDASCRVGGTTSSEKWRGVLTAGAAPRQLLLVGLASPVLLGDGFAPHASVGCRQAQNARDTVRAFAVDVSCIAGGASLEIAGGAHPTLRLASGTTATLDGKPLGTRAVALAPGAVISLDRAQTIIVDSLPAGALAFARWRNGSVERVASGAAPAIVASLDSVLARTIVTARAGDTATVALTLDVPASHAIETRLAQQCAALGGATSVVRRCSAIVVDADRGDVLALASWERPGLPHASYEPVDANFRAHRPGSVVKPILASAVLARYPTLASLGVAQPADTFSVAAGWPLGRRPMHAARNGCTEAVITWHCFLPNSSNRFAVTLGMFGLAEEPASGDLPAMGDHAEGPAMSIDGRVLTERPLLPAKRPQGYLASPLAHNLATLFDVHVGRQSVGAFDETLWRTAADSGLVRRGAVWQRVSPALPDLPLDDPAFRDLRHVAGFLIGETDNQWSNAALARSVARIATGRRVELRLLSRVGGASLPSATFDTLPFGTGRAAVMEGMRGVVRGTGTAHDVAAAFAPSLDLLGKTGTLESDALEPLSAFMFAGRAREGFVGACAVAGIVVVELEPGSAERLRAAKLFVDALGPTLRENFGWGGTTPCTRGR